jgi:glycosyltransferase involved in cell wall biosynthesis
MPFFSIIVPIYKVEKYLDECVQSVLSQSFGDYECVLVDDGSPDSCPAMCNEYAKKYEKMKVIHKENGGLSDARNAGILQASGEYVVLLDSDDKFANDDALQNLFGVIQKYKTDVVVNVNLLTFTGDGNVSFKNGYDKSISVAAPKEIYDEFYRTCPMTIFAGWDFVVNREHIIKNNLFFKKGILHEDEHWMSIVLFTTQQIAVNHSPFYAYRTVRDGSIMANVSPKRLFDKLSIADDLFELSKDEKTYTKDGCHIMKHRTIIFCEAVFTSSDEIKRQDKSAYRSICKELSQKVKKFSKTCPMPKYLIITAFVGVDKAKLLRKLYAKIRGLKKCLKSL